LTAKHPYSSRAATRAQTVPRGMPLVTQSGTLDLGPTRFRRVHFGELEEFPSLAELFHGNQAETLRCIDF
jgi:hypothetical protein